MLLPVSLRVSAVIAVALQLLLVRAEDLLSVAGNIEVKGPNRSKADFLSITYDAPVTPITPVPLGTLPEYLEGLGVKLKGAYTSKAAKYKNKLGVFFRSDPAEAIAAFNQLLGAYAPINVAEAHLAQALLSFNPCLIPATEDKTRFSGKTDAKDGFTPTSPCQGTARHMALRVLGRLNEIATLQMNSILKEGITQRRALALDVPQAWTTHVGGMIRILDAIKDRVQLPESALTTLANIKVNNIQIA